MYAVIVNPAAGNGAALSRLKEVEAALSSRGLKYLVERAQTSEDASSAARYWFSQPIEGIVAVGGDGTIFDVVNGFEASDVPLIFVSCGTGNDFVRSLGLPSDSIEALRVQLDAPLRRIDVGAMNGIRFLNVSGTGFDVDVLRHAEQYKRESSGLRPYLRGLRDAVRAYRPAEAHISIDDGPERRMRFAILSVSNGRYIGGGMKAVPSAVVDDGLLDVVIVRPIPRPLILPLIAFYIAGLHVALRFGRLRRCRKLRIRRPGMTINLDGELRGADEARYEILPGALAVRIP